MSSSTHAEKKKRVRKRPGVVVTSAGVIEVRIIERIDDLRALAPRLREVHRRSRRRSPFTTPEFIELYCRQNEYRKKLRPYVACAYRDGELVAYLPLKRVREGVGPLRYSKLEFLYTHDSGLPHVVARADVEAGAAATLVEYLLQHESSFAMLELKEQPTDSPLRASLARASTDGFYSRTFPGTDVGEVELLSARAPEAVEALFDLYLELEQRGWKTHGGIIGCHPERVAFFRDLILNQYPFSMLIDVLCVDGQPLAAMINGQHEGRLYALQSVYDETHRDSGPGGLILLWSMRRAIEEGLASYSLLHSFTYYKTRWPAEVTTTESLQFFRRGSLAYLRARLGELRRWMPTLEKLKPGMETLRRKVLDCKQAPGVIVTDRHMLTARLPFAV